MELKSLTAQLRQPQLQRGYVALWIFLVVWSYLKGTIPGVQGWGKYLWLIDYSEGIIKRGFAGAVIHGLGYSLENLGWERLEIFVLLLHSFTALFIVVLLLKIQRNLFLDRHLPRQTAILLAACWLLFACTQFWPTLAYNCGYVDIYLLLAYILAFNFFSQKQYIAAAIVGCIAVFIHEALVFLWLNILAVFILVPFLETRRIDWRSIGLSLLPFGAVFVLLLLHNQTAVVSEIQAIPDAVIEPAMKTMLIQAQFGQTVRSAIQVMLHIWRSNLARGLVALVYYTFPAFVMVLAVPLILGKYRQRMIKTVLIVLIAGCLPLSILLIAWDLSRFLVWANLTTVLTLTYFSTRELHQAGEESL